MSESFTEPIAINLNNITFQFNRYYGIFLLIIGLVGNILNIILFRRRNLRVNVCALFFLASSIANFLNIISGVTSRITTSWNVDPSNTNSLLCKLRIFIVFTTRTIFFWLTMLATVDRWLISSIDIHRRQLSSIKNAKRSMMIVIVFTILTYSQVFYCYEGNQINAPIKCFGKSTQCRLATDLSYAIITIATPIILMIVFNILIVLKVRQLIHRVQPINLPVMIAPTIVNPPPIVRRWRTKDRQMTITIIIQNSILIFLSMPINIQTFYSTLTANNPKSLFQKAVENLIFTIILLLTFTADAMPFYIYVLSNRNIFREEFLILMRNIYRKIIRFFE